MMKKVIQVKGDVDRFWLVCCWGLLLLVLLAGCADEALLPTSVPVAGLPPTPTRNTLPPTADFSLLTPSPVPPTPTFTPRSTLTPTPVAQVVNISSPEENAALVVGSDIIARGLVNLEETDTVWLALIDLTGRTLSQTQAQVLDVGWQASLTIPLFVNGAAFLQVGVLDASGETLKTSRLPVRLVLDAASEARYLALFRPAFEETAVAGFNFFFDGRAERPVGNVVRISIWGNDCQERLTRQSFVLRGSGYWQGFVVVPADMPPGPACAIATFGEPGEENWREVQIPIVVVDEADEAANVVLIGNPAPNSEVVAGQTVTLYGTAYNASESEVSVSVQLENGRVVSQSFAQTDYWGYWETPLILPVDLFGQAEITVSHGEEDRDGYAEAKTLIFIAPFPTPAP